MRPKLKHVISTNDQLDMASLNHCINILYEDAVKSFQTDETFKRKLLSLNASLSRNFVEEKSEKTKITATTTKTANNNNTIIKNNSKIINNNNPMKKIIKQNMKLKKDSKTELIATRRSSRLTNKKLKVSINVTDKSKTPENYAEPESSNNDDDEIGMKFNQDELDRMSFQNRRNMWERRSIESNNKLRLKKH